MTAPAYDTVVEILEEFAEDWGLDDLSLAADTKLKADMGFESTDTMQLFSALQEAYPQVKFQFQDLVMQDGKFVADLSVGQVSDFISNALKEGAT